MTNTLSIINTNYKSQCDVFANPRKTIVLCNLYFFSNNNSMHSLLYETVSLNNCFGYTTETNNSSIFFFAKERLYNYIPFIREIFHIFNFMIDVSLENH